MDTPSAMNMALYGVTMLTVILLSKRRDDTRSRTRSGSDSFTDNDAQ